MKSQSPPSHSLDRPDSFGWTSIILHWATAILVIILWIMGKGIELAPPELVESRRVAHVTLGLTVWLVLAVRIGWRLLSGHPRSAGQSDRTHRLAKLAHYCMLGLLTVMLLSGPVQAFSGAEGLVYRLAHGLHGLSATLLALLVALHIGAALKHLMFHDDETIARIFVPRKTDSDQPDPHPRSTP
ncbi:MAG: hypothetical protein RLZZ385_967 [Pseudomonadota bacterium]